MAYLGDTRWGKISTDNSSSSALGSSGTFTGTYEDTTGYTSLTLTFKRVGNVDCTVYVDFSPDGTNADFTKAYTVATTDTFFQTRQLQVSRKWMRIRVVNGTTAMTEMRLQAKLTRDSFPLISTPNQTVLADADVTLFRQANDAILDLSRSLFAGKRVVQKFGANTDIGTSYEYITSGGGTTYGGFLTSAIALRIRAGDAADDASGAGAREVIISGLDGSFNEQSSTITTAGTSNSSNTTETYIRLNSAYVSSTGTYGGTNTADIIIETTGGTEVLRIPAGYSQSQHAMYTVPAGYTAYLVQYEFISAGAKTATCRGIVRTAADDVTTPYTAARVVVEVPELDGSFSSNLKAYDSFPEKSDLYAMAKATTGTTSVTTRFTLILVSNS